MVICQLILVLSLSSLGVYSPLPRHAKRLCYVLTISESRFIPPLVGAIVVWSLAASFLLHSQSLRGPGTHSLDHWITPCNLLGIIPILHLLAFIPLDAVAGVRYVSAILLYRSIDAFLLSQASIWDPTSTFNVSNLLRIAPKFIALESEFSSLVPIWRGT